jgi:two-component system KDP operon response regulator KdpE
MVAGGAHVLVVDDEIAIRRFLRIALNSEGFVVDEAATCNQALVALTHDHLDLVILDLGLPDISGLEVIKQMREWTQIPVIIISVREQEQEKIAALDAGADDYLTKPFGMGELVARIRVVLRRQIPTSQQPIFQLGELKVDLSTRLVSVGDKEIQLTPTEYDILRVLVQNSGKVITNQQMLHKVWGEGYDDLHILRVNISNLRSKLEPNPSRPTYIHTEPGVGYRLHN